MRFLDFVISVVGIILLTPFFLLIILVLRFSGEGEIFFSQDRVGRDGQVFKLLKFATMLKDSPNIGAGTLTMKDDPRVLPFGKFLRKTKINEFPQLYNILCGDMSLVGPRPLIPSGEQLYQSAAAKRIRSVRPGLTGIGSLVFRDEEAYYSHRNDAKDFYKNYIVPHKQELELWYIKERNLLLNLKIILFTFIAVIFQNVNVVGYFKGLPEMKKALVESFNANSGVRNEDE